MSTNRFAKYLILKLSFLILVMKPITLCSLVLATLLIAACNPSKKNMRATTTSPVTTAPASTSEVDSGPSLPPKSKDGIFAPGNNEFVAVQAMYTDVSMEKLTQGYTIYTGVCTNCHSAKNIYSRPQKAWAGIIDDMAPKSKLTPEEKDAVYKYVMSIKVTQPK